jgi:O-antigen/teichoic acid export membrane protein
MRKSYDLTQNNMITSRGQSHGMHITVGTLQSFAASSLSLPTGILTAAFLSRTLGPANYGALTVAASIVIWIESAITMGFSHSAEKFVAETDNWRSVSTRFIQVQLFVSLLAALLLVFISPRLASWFGTDEVADYLRLFSIGIPFAALFNIHQSILIGRGYFGSRAFLIGTYWLIRMVFIILFVELWPSVTSAIMALIATHVFLFIIARFFINPALLGASGLSFTNLWDFALPLFLYAVGLSLFNRLDLFFVKGLAGAPQAAGYFAAAKNLTIVPALFMASLAPILISRLTLLCSQGQRESAQTIVQKTIRLTFSLLPFAGMAAGAAVEVVLLIYGQSFLAAGPLLGILIFAAIGASIIVVSAAALIAAERPDLTLYLILPILGAAFWAHHTLVPRFGTTGAAGVTTVLSWLGAVGCLLAVYRLWRVWLPFSTIVRSLTICVFAYILSLKWQTPGLLLLLKLPLVSLVIIFLFTFFGEFSKNEINFVSSIVDWRAKVNVIKDIIK